MKNGLNRLRLRWGWLIGKQRRLVGGSSLGVKWWQWQKTFNATIASLRAGIEHCIAQLKNWKILKTGHRGPLHELPNIIQTITKLELYRLSW